MTVPRDVDGNGIADIYEMAQVNGWNGLYANVTNAAKVWLPGCWGSATNDTELAELGLMRTDGDYSHGAGGDGLSVLDEYRGYVLDGGTNGFAAGHHRLSFSRKELLVEVSELPGLAEKGANSLNPAAATNFNSHAVMTAVADFYSNPTRGMGIDLYWATDELVYPPHPICIDNVPILFEAYRFIGDLSFDYHTSIQIPENGESHTLSDTRLKSLNGELKIIGEALYKQYYKKNKFCFLRFSRSIKLDDFSKLVFLDRTCDVLLINNHVIGDVSHNNALTSPALPDYRDEGSYVCAVAMAEERPFTNNTNIHYSKTEYIELLNWSVAHEIGHQLITRQQYSSTLTDSYGHINQMNALMNAKRSDIGLSTVSSHRDELILVVVSTALSTCH